MSPIVSVSHIHVLTSYCIRHCPQISVKHSKELFVDCACTMMSIMSQSGVVECVVKGTLILWMPQESLHHPQQKYPTDHQLQPQTKGLLIFGTTMETYGSDQHPIHKLKHMDHVYICPKYPSPMTSTIVKVD